jgi:hypothetical protein
MKPTVKSEVKMSDAFLIQNGLKQGDALLPLLFNFGFKYAISKVHENQEGLEFNVIHQLLVYADNVNIMDKNINTMNKNTESQRLVGRLV